MAAGKGHPRMVAILLTITMLALMVIGIFAIMASEKVEGTSGFAKKQAIYAIVSLVAFVCCSLIPYQILGRWAYPFFGVTLGLLVLVFFLPEVRGSHRWIDLKVFKLQPSELAKLSFIVLLAWYLRFGDHYRRLRGLILPFILTFIPMFLILREPDLGTALLFLPTLYFMLMMAGAKWRHLLGIILIGTIVVLFPFPKKAASMSPSELADRKATAYWTMDIGEEEYVVSATALAMMKSHQLHRVDGWLRQNDPAVVQGRGFHLHQSKIVLGSGKLGGMGDWDEAEFFFRMLPDDHTDFIYSVIGGQWGFVGASLVLVLYLVIFLLGIEVSWMTYDPFGRLLAIGTIGLMISQVFINVGMTMGLMPITGMTLPFVSYGGSSLLINAAAMGLLINVALHQPIYLSRRPFEHDEDLSGMPYRPLEGVRLGAAARAGARREGGGDL